MNISFGDWDGSVCAREKVASLAWDEVQVWIATVSADKAVVTALAGLLSPDERMRAGRLVPEARRLFVFGRACLRQTLAAGLNTDPHNLVFRAGPHGKPSLADTCAVNELRFNLAHSRSMVAIALARGRDVGVDIEWIDDLTNLAALGARVFSRREFVAWRSLAESRQRAAFYHGWTCKEAYLKATGEGLTGALRRVEVTLAPDREPELLSLPDGPAATHRWAVRRIPLPPEYAGAVVYESATPNTDSQKLLSKRGGRMANGE